MVDYPKMSNVVRVDRSPLNKKQWLLELDCGHEVWITSSRKPTRKSTYCYHADHKANISRDKQPTPSPSQGEGGSGGAEVERG